MKSLYKLLLTGTIITILSAGYLRAEKEEVVVWAMGYEGTVIKQMAAKFEELHPEIDIITQAVPWGAAHEKLLTSVVGGVPPDVSQMGTTWIAEFQSMGAFEPLNKYLEKSVLKPEEFFQSTFKIGDIEGKNYGIPWYIDTRVLFYRKDILKKVGYDHPPKTWDELLDVSTKLARDTNGDGKVDTYGISLPVADWGTFMMFLWQAGDSILSDDHKKIKALEPEVTETMEYYKKFFEKGAAPLEISGTDPLWAFREGFYPMFISGPWMIDQIKKELPEIEGKWSVSMLPGNKSRTSFVGGSHLVMFKDSKHKEAAWKFIEYMSMHQNQLKWFEISGGLPSNIKAWESGYFEDKPLVKVFGNQMYDTKSPPNIPEWEEMASKIDRRLEEVLRGGKSVHQMQKDLYGDLKTILAQKEKREGENLIFWIIVISLISIAFLFLYIKKLKIKHGRVTAIKNEEKEDIREIPGGMMGKGWKKMYIPMLFILPSVITLAMFLFLPIFSSFLISLTDWNVYTFSDISKLSFIGFENYTTLFQDKVFWQALFNTFIFSILGIPLNIILALMVAIMIDKKFIEHKAIFRAGYFMPVITTLVAVAVIWRWLYNPEYGLINYLLGFLNISPQYWLNDPFLALPSLIVMSVWKNFGYNMVIILAGLQTIPSTMYEAASVDGADGWQTFWNITLPSLKSTLFFVIVMTTIGSFQFFAEPYIMTEGGPLNKTLSMVMYMYNQGFEFFKFGYGSAVGYILFICILMFTMIQLLYRKKLEEI